MSNVSAGQFSFNFNNSTNIDELNSNVAEIKKQGERRYYRDSNGRLVEVYKNLKRIIL